jgi:hypothetical protein
MVGCRSHCGDGAPAGGGDARGLDQRGQVRSARHSALAPLRARSPPWGVRRADRRTATTRPALVAGRAGYYGSMGLRLMLPFFWHLPHQRREIVQSRALGIALRTAEASS